MADGALNCFTSLLECIPGWIEDLEGTVKNASERQKDILCENQPVEPEQAQPRRASESSSVRTRRSKESKDAKADGVQIITVDESVPTLVKTQRPHMTQSDELRLAQRKRKTVSACSDRQSGPLKYRSRSTVVIYYDGEIQKRFENIVRAIGTKRHALGKGRTSAQVYELARKGSSGSEGSSGDDSGAYLPKMVYRSARMRRSPGSGSRSEGLASFDKLDEFLEKAQAQCERAAHQILRDGDCGLEIQTAKERIIEARMHCETEASIWWKRVEEAEESERLDEERRKEDEADDQAESHEAQPTYCSDEKLVADPFTAAVPLEVDMEPDDSDGGGDGNDLTINLMQLGRARPYMRTPRLTAH